MHALTPNMESFTMSSINFEKTDNVDLTTQAIRNFQPYLLGQKKIVKTHLPGNLGSILYPLSRMQSKIVRIHTNNVKSKEHDNKVATIYGGSVGPAISPDTLLVNAHTFPLCIIIGSDNTRKYLFLNDWLDLNPGQKFPTSQLNGFQLFNKLLKLDKQPDPKLCNYDFYQNPNEYVFPLFFIKFKYDSTLTYDTIIWDMIYKDLI